MKKKKILKSGFVIKPLSVISFICIVLSCSSYFFYYDYGIINGEWICELTYNFPSFDNLISLLLTIIPILFFCVYIFRFYPRLKCTMLVPIILGLFPFRILYGISFPYYSYVSVSLAMVGLISLIIKIPIFILCILGVISALKGIKKKISIIIVMGLCLLEQAIYLIRFIQHINYYIESEHYLYLLTDSLSIVGWSLFYIAFLLFSIRNRIPSIIMAKKKTNGAINPERELKILKDKLELGVITEDEYRNERAYIISKL